MWIIRINEMIKWLSVIVNVLVDILHVLVSVTWGDDVRNLNIYTTQRGIVCKSAAFLMWSGKNFCKSNCSKYTAGMFKRGLLLALKSNNKINNLLNIKTNIQPRRRLLKFVMFRGWMKQQSSLLQDTNSIDIYCSHQPLPYISEVWHQPLPDSWAC